MRKLLWKKAAITAMAGTMMMMTGCELQGTVNKNSTTSTAAWQLKFQFLTCSFCLPQRSQSK